jgi:hypothetical protein
MDARPVRQRSHSDRGRQGVRRAQHNVFRLASQFDSQPRFITAGRKAHSLPGAAGGGWSRSSYATADAAEVRAIAAFARDLFKGEVEGADRRRSIRQHADAGGGTVEPCRWTDHGLRCGAESEEALAADTADAERISRSWDTSSATIIYIYNVLLNAKASEQSAGMVSMKTRPTAPTASSSR